MAAKILPIESKLEREYYTRAELFQKYGIPEKTWAKMGLFGTGPAYRVICGKARYHINDVEAFLASCPMRGGRSEAA